MLFTSKFQECPACGSTEFQKYGRSHTGEPRYRCKQCNGQYTLSKRKNDFERHRYMALSLYLSGLSFRHIARELRVSNTAVGKWIRDFIEQEPALKVKRLRKKTHLMFATTRSLSTFNERPNLSMGGLFIQSDMPLFKNKVVTIEYIRKAERQPDPVC